MLDINFIRNNQEIVAQKAAQKGYPVDIGALVKLDNDRRLLQAQINKLRQERNLTASQGQHGDNEQSKGRAIKEKLSKLEAELKNLDPQYLQMLRSVPNLPLEDVPIGTSEAENIVVKTVGEPPRFNFKPLSHAQIGEALGLIDKERAAKVAGSRFVYLKGNLVKLQFALINFVLSELTSAELISRLIKDNGLNLKPTPFIPVLTPALLKTAPYEASARLNAEEMTYKIEQDDLWLNASAEHTLCTMHMNEVVPADLLPLRYIGYSTSFRREAGSYGKDMEGIFRLHQFDKLEMEVLSDATSGLAEHQLLIVIEEHLLSSLGLSYQVVNKCSADIGKPNAHGVDINTWFPSQNNYRETHTADYMTDYQARDLKIRTKDNGDMRFVHTNDATAFALGRIMAALVENYQDEDGHFAIPEVLWPFMAGITHI
ncbi:serine--tRNA ligase [Patescibacteria group bacterium]|nr:serine--tRNA ligase [Patescibacteria group bacterium]